MEKLFFKQGLIIGLILLGQGDKQYFFFQKTRSNVLIILIQTFFWTKILGPPRFLATIANLPNNAWVQNSLFFFGTIANLAINQDTTLVGIGDTLF